MTVKELFEAEKITESNLWDIQDESPYWETAGLFVLDNWNFNIEMMSAKQAAWLNKIHEEMTERRIEGKL